MPENDNRRSTTDKDEGSGQSQQLSKPPDGSRTDNEALDADSGTRADSLGNRIQNSAFGLARNAVFSRSSASSDLSQSALASGNKGGSFASSGALGSSAEVQRQYDPAPTSAPSTSRGPSGQFTIESFRSSGPVREDQGRFDEDFQYTYGNDEGLLGSNSAIPGDTDEGRGKGKGKARQGDYDQGQSTFDAAWQIATPSSVNHHQTLDNPSDGAAVVSLLSDHSFDPDFATDPDAVNKDTDLLPPAPLTNAEIEMIDSFRRLFPDTSLPRQDQQQHRLGPTSLVPDINAFLDSAPALTQSDAASLRDTVLSSLPGATDWVGVEERYHDEVWGYLRPTLEAAQNEIETQQQRPHEGTGPIEGPAVRRLRMILKHMQP